MTEFVQKYNADKNILHVTILRPYYTVGKMFGWDVSATGLGLPLFAIHETLRRKSLLSVYVADEDRTYWVGWHKLEDWMSRNEHLGENHGKPIIYFPVDICSREVKI